MTIDRFSISMVLEFHPRQGSSAFRLRWGHVHEAAVVQEPHQQRFQHGDAPSWTGASLRRAPPAPSLVWGRTMVTLESSRSGARMGGCGSPNAATHELSACHISLGLGFALWGFLFLGFELRLGRFPGILRFLDPPLFPLLMKGLGSLEFSLSRDPCPTLDFINVLHWSLTRVGYRIRVDQVTLS
jgi:hypothetical protein